jgi:DNA-binding beta-propeller fold protein YncE
VSVRSLSCRSFLLRYAPVFALLVVVLLPGVPPFAEETPAAAPPPQEAGSDAAMKSRAKAALPVPSEAAKRSAGVPEVFREEIVRQDAKIELTVRPLLVPEITEGELAEVSLRITDAVTGTPIGSLAPSAWLDVAQRPGAEGVAATTCDDKIRAYLGGIVGYRPMLDLNSYYILGMNNDATISVFDPVQGVSGVTQLYTMIYLKRPGEDWADDREGKHIFVTMPRANAVAVANLETFKVVEEIPVGENPVRIARQPDGKYLWALLEPKGKGGGMAVIDAETKKVVATLPGGKGHHEIAFTDDSLHAFATNAEDGTLSVYDIRALKKLRDVPVGKFPVAVGYSARSKAAYVASAATGEIAVVDGKSHEVVARIPTAPGLRAMRLAPGGRFGIAANQRESRAYVIDTSTNRVVREFPTEPGPDQVAFTEDFLYIRSGKSPTVTVLKITALEQEGTLPVVTVRAGNLAPGDSRFGSVADAISPALVQGHALIANPSDARIYYYMEGMNAPMGSYRSVGGQIPRAVRVVDRTLKEGEKGVYSAKVRLPVYGKLQLALLLDNPRVIHCFEFAAKENPIWEGDTSVGIEYLTEAKKVPAGGKYTLRFKLFRERGSKPVEEQKDVLVQVVHPTWMTNEKYRARHVGEGIYEADFVLSRPGPHYVLVTSLGLGLHQDALPHFMVLATPLRGEEEVGKGE